MCLKQILFNNLKLDLQYFNSQYFKMYSLNLVKYVHFGCTIGLLSKFDEFEIFQFIYVSSINEY